MPKYYSVISLLLFPLVLGACAKKNAVEHVGVQCNRLIQEAVAAHKAHRDSLDKNINEKVSNLIKAAKIDQQHGLYSSCSDKAYRAGSLIGKKAPPTEKIR